MLKSNPSLSAGYYFQYMVDNAVLTLPSTALAPGHLFHCREMPQSFLTQRDHPSRTGEGHVQSSKLRDQHPLALTLSNRTDLIKATDVREENFG